MDHEHVIIRTIESNGSMQFDRSIRCRPVDEIIGSNGSLRFNVTISSSYTIKSNGLMWSMTQLRSYRPMGPSDFVGSLLCLRERLDEGVIFQLSLIQTFVLITCWPSSYLDEQVPVMHLYRSDFGQVLVVLQSGFIWDAVGFYLGCGRVLFGMRSGFIWDVIGFLVCHRIFF